jgi:parallel beta-helix repeat protein
MITKIGANQTSKHTSGWEGLKAATALLGLTFPGISEAQAPQKESSAALSKDAQAIPSKDVASREAGVASESFEPREYVIPPGPQAQEMLRERFVKAVPGDVIQLEEGTYHLTHQLDLVTDSVTIRGRGSERTILSFKNQSGGSHGIEACSNNLLLQGFAVEDTAGDAIKVLGSKNVIFRNVRAEWTGEASVENGAYGLYPVQCQNVLVEDCIARGSSDAGLYVGQCRGVVVRRCLAERNVAGFEIENTIGADVYDNVARNNAGGILVFDLPGLPQKNGSGVRVFRNLCVDNNHRNFADAGAIVASVPPGTGVMILGTDQVEVFDNDIKGNNSASVIVLSFDTVGRKYDDRAYDPIPEDIWIHGNRISNGGTKPEGEIATQLVPLFGKKLPDILWDGIVPAGTTRPRLRLGDNGAATYANFRIKEITTFKFLTGWVTPKTDPKELSANLAPLPPIELKPFDPPSRELPAALRFYRKLPMTLSEHRLFSGAPALQVPAEGVVQYNLSTELFTDYAIKRRFIRLPEGGAMGYRESGTLEFPVGTLIAKTFSFPDTKATGGERLIETRIEMHTPEGWFGASYVWNEAQTDAVLCLAGRQVEVSRLVADGGPGKFQYEVPGANQCISCHSQTHGDARPAYEPLGPTAANMNRRAADSERNQLALLAEAGYLRDLPEIKNVPVLPAAFDPQTGSVAERARAWLDMNCSHCHNPEGTARTTGLDLRREQTDLARMGLWKGPVAAGHGAGGRLYDIVPGKPDESIMVHRLETDQPGMMMPPLGRRLVHDEGIELVRKWIEQIRDKK